VAHANDPHTLLFTTDATFTINPHLYTKLPYDFERDFTAITQLVSFSQLLVVGQRTGINSMAELMDLARAKPEALSYSSYGPGSQPQLATELFKQKSGLSILHVPYKGIPQAIAAVVADEVSMSWSGVVSAKPFIANKRIKPVAFGGKTRSPFFPEVPTMTELGYPEVDANVWVGLFAPKVLSSAVVQRINKDVLAVLNDPAFKANEMDAKGYDYSGLGPDEFNKHIKAELVSRKTAVKLSGVSL
jgi:tripartite-type tricarboxylate transporter receptor subunit TctC